MELYHNNMSVCAQKVRLVLAEKGLKPLEHHLNLRAGEATTPQYLKLNPNGVIPTLIDHGRVIIESTVICEYLDDAYPDIALRPPAPADRALMRLWTRLPDAGLHQACGITSFAIAFRQQMLAQPRAEIERQLAEKPDPQVRENLRATIELGLDAPQVRKALADYRRAIGRMAQQLESTTWLAGSGYSLADAALLPYVCRLEQLGMSWLWSGTHRSIAGWLERSKARANYSGIRDYLDPKYLELMQRASAECGSRLRELLTA